MLIRLANHLAHLWVRDPLVLYDEFLDVNNENQTDHFENIQGTNWQTLRWKPPPPPTEGSAHVGWRTEVCPVVLEHMLADCVPTQSLPAHDLTDIILVLYLSFAVWSCS